MTEWQPIETAPRDDEGPPLLLWIDGDMAVGYWLEDEWVPNDATVASTAFIVQPTYWMPLPEPPEGWMSKQTDEVIARSDACDHYWISNSGLGGEPKFRPLMGWYRMPVKCQKCNARTWFTREQWANIPVRSEL